MHDIGTEILEVVLAGGWRGQAIVRAGGKEMFSKADWEKLLAEPEKLLEGAQKMLKSEGLSTVAVKHMEIGGRGVRAVIKRRNRSGGIRDFFRSMGKSHAIQNFDAAIKAKECGLPVAAPLAAVYHRKFLVCDKSIYISEYIDGPNLHEFLRNMRAQTRERFLTMREITRQLAGIFAKLHKCNLWHRDAKATNFVVHQDGDGQYHVVVTDVDGIKRYLSHSEERQMEGLWRLAASVMGLPGINRTDYLRAFEMYCDEARIPEEQRLDIYRWLAHKTLAKYCRIQAKQGR